MTSSNGNIFRVTGPLCGEFTGPGEFPTQRSVTRSFDVYVDLRLNIRLSKQPWGWWFDTPSCPLWCQCNVYESVVNDQLLEFFSRLFNDLIGAYRKGYSCQSLVVKCIDNWKNVLDKQMFIGTLFMGLSKAFDCLPHSLVQYIPRNLHTVLLCFALLWLCNHS